MLWRIKAQMRLIVWRFYFIFFFSLQSKLCLQLQNSGIVGGENMAGESKRNLNSRSLTVADHGIQAMPPCRALLNELKITGLWLFLGQSSVQLGEFPRDRWIVRMRVRQNREKEKKGSQIYSIQCVLLQLHFPFLSCTYLYLEFESIKGISLVPIVWHLVRL